MNERIKELAEQCWDRRLDGVHFDQEKFANLVAAHEREECAKVANAWQTDVLNPQYHCDCATAIRARGEK